MKRMVDFKVTVRTVLELDDSISLDDIRNGEVILKYGYRSDRGIGVNLVDIEPTDVLISIEDEYNGDTQGI